MTWSEILSLSLKVLAVTVVASLVVIVVYSVVYTLVKGTWR